MNTRFAIPLLCAAAIAFACGPRVHTSSLQTAATPVGKSATRATAKPAPARRHAAVPVGSITSALDVRVGDQVQFALRVANPSDQSLELTFPSGATHDFAVLDSAGKTMWRWSAGRLFTQSLQNRTIDARDSETFDGEWTPPANYHGKLTAVATLAAADHPVETRAEFTLP
jgi:intracellular proteinase inhibitor BsuPI